MTEDEQDAFFSNLLNQVEIGDKAERMRIAVKYRDFSTKLADMLGSAYPKKRAIPIEYANGASSRQFMIDILPKLQAYIGSFPRKSRFRMIDVGCGSAFGSQLVASLYATKSLGYTIQVTALDIRDHLDEYITAFHKNVKFMKNSLFSVSEKYDIVTCNAVVEHVPNPLVFCERLKQICIGRAFVYVPYLEPDIYRSRGHCNVFGQDFIEQARPIEWAILKSPAWGAGYNPSYDMLLMEFEGTGNK